MKLGYTDKLNVIFSGISSLTFTKSGEALYLHSSSELQRISLSASKVTKAHCALNLPPNARSSPEPVADETKDTSTTESEEKKETTEEVVEEEKKTESQAPSPPVLKVITENGVSGSSEFFSILLPTYCFACFC